jgi:hypothetical protein
MTLRRIWRLPLGISSSRRQSSSSWTARASFSKCTGFSLAFAQGLRRWLPVAAHLDLRSTLRWQCALAVDSRQDLLGMAASAWGEKTLRVSASICKSTGGSSTAGWISFKTADSVAAPDPSTSSSRCASSWGLGYI